MHTHVQELHTPIQVVAVNNVTIILAVISFIALPGVRFWDSYRKKIAAAKYTMRRQLISILVRPLGELRPAYIAAKFKLSSIGSNTPGKNKCSVPTR